MIRPEGFPELPNTWEYVPESVMSFDHRFRIFLNVWRRKNAKCDRGLLIIHGQGEHGGRYQHFPHFLDAEYDLIVAPDLRGHGRSHGIRGHVEHFDHYLDDALCAFEYLKTKLSSNAVKDWFGHSMGGLISARALGVLDFSQIRLMILSSPALGLRVEVPFIKKWSAEVLKFVWPSLQIPTGLDPKKVSTDSAVVRSYQKDQLNHSKATPQFFFQFLDAQKELLAREALHLPESFGLLLQVAGEDEIVDSDLSEKWFDGLSGGRRKKIRYPGLYHEIYNEVTKDFVFQDFKNFIHKDQA